MNCSVSFTKSSRSCGMSVDSITILAVVYLTLLVSSRFVINTLRPSDASKCSVVQIMICDLFSTEPLSDPMIFYN